MISVIVPVYKVEKYLDRCVSSILAQTYKDFELILVDDGSPDNCPKMCDDYAKIDNRIKVLHKQNGGLSDARNAGIDFARGEYITYIDSDDYINKEYLKILFDNLIRFDATISAINLSFFYENKEFIEPIIENKVYSLSGQEALCNMLYQKDLDTHAWGILLPQWMAKKYKFPVGKNHEDELITYNYYFDSKLVAVSTAKAYYYFQRNDSIMHTFGKNSVDEIYAADQLELFCKINAPFALKAAQSKKFSDYCQVLLSVDDLEKIDYEMYRHVEKYLTKVRRQILFDKKVRKKNRVAACALFCGTKSLRRLNRLKNKIAGWL